MKISAIQNYYPCCSASKVKNARKCAIETPKDTVSFQGNNTAKGAGIGALIGLGALAIISGGAAAPIAYAAYAATMGTAGGMLGHAIDKTDEDKKQENKDNNK